jgi:hypothetical protein
MNMDEAYVDARVQLIEDVEFMIRNVDNIDLNNVVVDVSAGKFSVDLEEKLITFETGIKFFYKVSESEHVDLLLYVNHTGFYVENIIDVVKVDNGSPYIDKGIVRLFLETVIPTIRGILAVKTSGTSLSKAYLPIYKIENLIK